MGYSTVFFEAHSHAQRKPRTFQKAILRTAVSAGGPLGAAFLCEQVRFLKGDTYELPNSFSKRRLRSC